MQSASKLEAALKLSSAVSLAQVATTTQNKIRLTFDSSCYCWGGLQAVVSAVTWPRVPSPSHASWFRGRLIHAESRRTTETLNRHDKPPRPHLQTAAASRHLPACAGAGPLHPRPPTRRTAPPRVANLRRLHPFSPAPALASHAGVASRHQPEPLPTVPALTRRRLGHASPTRGRLDRASPTRRRFVCASPTHRRFVRTSPTRRWGGRTSNDSPEHPRLALPRASVVAGLPRRCGLFRLVKSPVESYGTLNHLWSGASELQQPSFLRPRHCRAKPPSLLAGSSWTHLSYRPPHRDSCRVTGHPRDYAGLTKPLQPHSFTTRCRRFTSARCVAGSAQTRPAACESIRRCSPSNPLLRCLCRLASPTAPPSRLCCMLPPSRCSELPLLLRAAAAALNRCSEPPP